MAIVIVFTFAPPNGRAAFPPVGRRYQPAALAPATSPVVVTFDDRGPGPPVPPRFLGLSFEMSSLPLIARYAHRGDFVALLRSLGPGVLRFGGVSADATKWTQRRAAGPLWPATSVARQDLQALGVLAARTGWRVLLTVNLAQPNPRAAASEVAAARHALGTMLAGVEIGNEPDSYGRHGVRPQPWGFAQYTPQVAAIWGQIHAITPGVALAGPDVSGSGGGATDAWVAPEAFVEHPVLLTGHYYSLSCNNEPPPSISALLSERTRQGMQLSLTRYMAVARSASIPFRVDEANNVSCGGEAGISNTFASALWAVQFLVRAMSAGVVGVNLHGHIESCGGYSPLCAVNPAALFADHLRAQPEWYALLFAKPLVGDRPIRAYAYPADPDIDVHSFAGSDGTLQVVIVDTAPAGTPDARLQLTTAGHFARAIRIDLAAPSLSATAGVTLGGRVVSAQGTWRGPRPTITDIRDRQSLTVSVPAASAAMVTLARR